MDEIVARAAEHFARIVEEQLARVERMKGAQQVTDFALLNPLVIGVCPGDGIGPIITRESVRMLKAALHPRVAYGGPSRNALQSREPSSEPGTVEFRTIEGLTIENRVAHMKAIPDAVLAEIKACHVILKAPTTTPEKGGPYPNIESANVAMRRELDLFANVRPVKIPKEGIDWVFFRENTEGPYILGSQGIMVTEDLAIDFTATTLQGSERLIRMAFAYAQKNGVDRITGVTKANVIKSTDGLFLQVGEKVSREFPGIRWDGWYADIVSAKLLDPKRRKDFRVFALPNLYGDILTDEAAELQGGVGTAGSANIGTRHAMFEAIHGSAPRMITEGRGEYADPSSMARASVMLLRHIGRLAAASRLEMALDICGQFEQKVVITGRPTGGSASDFGDYVLETMADPTLERRWAAGLTA